MDMNEKAIYYRNSNVQPSLLNFHPLSKLMKEMFLHGNDLTD